jgi:hypothetical protein
VQIIRDSTVSSSCWDGRWARTTDRHHLTMIIGAAFLLGVLVTVVVYVKVFTIEWLCCLYKKWNYSLVPFLSISTFFFWFHAFFLIKSFCDPILYNKVLNRGKKKKKKREDHYVNTKQCVANLKIVKKLLWSTYFPSSSSILLVFGILIVIQNLFYLFFSLWI